MSKTLEESAIVDATRLLEAHPDFKVIRRIPLRTAFAEDGGRNLSKGVVVDTETTGLDPDKDAIIELGMVLFEFDPETGRAYKILGSFSQLEDPLAPIPLESIAVHGITDEMVAGKQIDPGLTLKDSTCASEAGEKRKGLKVSMTPMTVIM